MDGPTSTVGAAVDLGKTHAGAASPAPGAAGWGSLLRPWTASRRSTALVAGYVIVLSLAAVVRFWDLTRVGYNSDEAVYTGSAASIAGNESLRPMFPIFRAHPLLFQLLVSLGLHGGVSDWTGRAFAAGIGIATVALIMVLGNRLYGRSAGVIAGLILAIMPYHVIVTRQVLLDGLMTFCATAVLYCVVRYSESTSARWMIATGATMGATFLSKETSLVLVGGLYLYFVLTPVVRVRLAHVALGLVSLVAVVVAYPVTLAYAGRSGAGQHYLLWQMFRRSNHSMWFYAGVVPWAVGPLVVVLAVGGLVWLRRENTWRERLLISWIAVPAVFFTLWPVKGYQYLLPIAPAVALLAGRAVAYLPTARPLVGRKRAGQATMVGLAAITAVTLVIPTIGAIRPSSSGRFTAGTGGVPGGREAGRWIHDHVPLGSQLLAIGPSTANILEFYGRRRVYGLSVSPDPRSRNPAYTPVVNPDREVRRGDVQYLVWDSYTASRAEFFARTMSRLIDKYDGTAVFTATVPVHSKSGSTVKPVVIIYEMHPRP